MYSQVYLWLSLELWTREWPKEGGVPVLGGPARQRPRATEKLPPAAEGGAEGASSPPAPDKVKALFTGAVMTPEVAPKSTLQEEGNLCPQSGLSPPGVNMNTPWWEGAGAPHPSQGLGPKSANSAK